MAALTKDTPATVNVGTHADIPMAAEVLYDGSILSYNSSGYAGAFTLGERFAGHAMEGKDNSAGSAGDLKIRASQSPWALAQFKASPLSSITMKTEHCRQTRFQTTTFLACLSAQRLSQSLASTGLSRKAVTML